jgi:glycosyltransferase involved in cell wall biosynthesis
LNSASERARQGREVFSLIVPALNEENNLPALLESIITQTYKPLEIVIVDDGSTDGTASVVKRFAGNKTSADLTVVYTKTGQDGRPRGVAYARNLGIDRSTGSRILLLDADFILSDPNILAELGEALEKNPTARFRANTQAENWLERNMRLDRERLLIAHQVYLTAGMLPSTALRREVLGNLRFDELLGVGEDKDFLIRLARKGIPPAALISAQGLKRNPRSLWELAKQKEWAGRTYPLFLRKHGAPRNILLLAPVGPFVLAALAVAGFFLNSWVAMISTAAFLAIVVAAFIKSPKKGPRRLAYLAFVRFGWVSLFFAIGMIRGIHQFLFLGQVGISRDR